MELICERFAGGPGPQWQTHVVGAGSLEATGTSLKFVTEDAVSDRYSNSQIDDYQGLPRNRLAWHPPLRLTVRARFSHAADQLRGTAGFGFWNDPLLMTQKRLPALPRAVWFFYASAPSHMKFDADAPGHGWKVASIDAQHAAALVWAPLAPLLVPLLNLGPVYNTCWQHIQRALRIREAVIPVDMTQWHTYELHWGKEYSRFRVTGEGAGSSSPLLAAPSPRGPLGLVLWQDNQYLALAPWGYIRWGLLNVPSRQWMEVDCVEISPREDDQSEQTD